MEHNIHHMAAREAVVNTKTQEPGLTPKVGPLTVSGRPGSRKAMNREGTALLRALYTNMVIGLKVATQSPTETAYAIKDREAYR